VSELGFLSSRPAEQPGFEPRPHSPLERALASAPAGLTDLTLALAKFEVRGDLGRIDAGELLRITPGRGLVVAPAAEAEAVETRLRAQVETVLDRTGALAALRIEGSHAPTLMRRLTDLDLERLPAVGAVARVRTIVRGGGESFELFFPQEYGHYVATVVVDAAEGLAA
jgi:sarcosine oxidase gamma subunit